MKFYFLLGMIFSKLFNYPSKYFSITMAWILMLLALFFSSSITPLFKMLPALIIEWVEAGVDENFLLYLVLVSFTLILFAAVSLISVAALELAFFVKQRFNVRIMQW